MLAIQQFAPEVELAKAIDLIRNDASNHSYTVSEADGIVRQKFADDDSCNGGGFFAAYFRKPGVKIAGLRSSPFAGGTMLSTFCTPDMVKGHYKDVKYFRDSRMGVVVYSTPKNLEILSEQV
jgi:hypothetical protein